MQLSGFLIILGLFFFVSFNKLFSKEINWTEVANINNQIQYIDTNSIKYNNRGLLSVVTKFSEITPDEHNIINTKSYLIAIDCKSRLFSKLPINGDINKVKNWKEPNNDILIKKTILNSCSY